MFFFRWFRHFYIFSGPASTIILCLILYKFLLNGNIPEIVFALLDILLGASRKSLSAHFFYVEIIYQSSRNVYMCITIVDYSFSTSKKCNSSHCYIKYTMLEKSLRDMSC